MQALACFGPLRMLGTPLLAVTFLPCACLAPARFSRWSLLVASGVEGLVAAYTAFGWLIAPRLL